MGKSSFKKLVIDTHVHCSDICVNRRAKSLPAIPVIDDYMATVDGTGIGGVVAFEPLQGFCGSLNPEFLKRQSGQKYKEAATPTQDGRHPRIFLFLSVSRGCEPGILSEEYSGLNWYSRPDDLREFLRRKDIREGLSGRRLPVIFRGNIEDTTLFVDSLPGSSPVIIPHCGLLNGGYDRLAEAGIWSREDVYTCTSASDPETVTRYVDDYGDNRIFFGSGFPFGDPVGSIAQIHRLGLTEDGANKLLFGNALRLLSPWNEKKMVLKTGGSVRIRAANPGDTERFMDYIRGLSPESRDFMHGWHIACSPEKAPDHASKLAERTENPGNLSLVAVTDGAEERIAGYCWIEGLGVSERPMLGIGVVDRCHGSGLGAELMRCMLGWAGRSCLKRVWLGVFADNKRAIGVYRKIGFREDPDCPPRDFNGRTELYMVADTRQYIDA